MTTLYEWPPTRTQRARWAHRNGAVVKIAQNVRSRVRLGATVCCMNMNQRRTMWEQYVKSWKAPSSDEKRALFASCLSPDCIYQDPLTERQGHDALVEYMVDFHAQIPGGHFMTQEFFAHHQSSIARWAMMSGDGSQLGEGVSYGEYGQDGKLVRMTGFFEAPGGDADR